MGDNNGDLEDRVERVEKKQEKLEKKQDGLTHRIRTAFGHLREVGPSTSYNELVERLRKAVTHFWNMGTSEGEQDEQDK